MGRLFHIVQRGGDWAGPQAVQATLAFDGWTVTFGTAKRGLRPLFAVPNVTVHPSKASVHITLLMSIALRFYCVHDTLTRNRRQKPVYQKTAVPVSGTSDMQFVTEFFWYEFLVTNKTCSVLCRFMVGLVRVFGADFWYVCHGHIKK